MADDAHTLPTPIPTATATTLIDQIRRCARQGDDVGAAAAVRALMAIDHSMAALIAAEVFGNSTDWLNSGVQ